MYELKKIGKLFTSKYFGTGPSSYEKRIYRAAVSQRWRNTGVEGFDGWDLRKRDHLGGLGVDGRIILKCISKIGLIWLSTGTGGESL